VSHAVRSLIARSKRVRFTDLRPLKDCPRCGGGGWLCETPCSVWDIGGGISLRNLTTEVAMTLRASAPGYNTVERSLFPKLAGTVEEFVLERQ